MSFYTSIIVSVIFTFMLTSCNDIDNETINNKLYSHFGRIDDTVQGWTFTPSKKNAKMAYNESEGYYPDKGGKLFGPPIEGIKEFLFYELTFTASAEDNCYWGVMFYDQNDEPIVADVYSSIYKGKNLKYKQVVYARENCKFMRPFFQSNNGVEVFDLMIKEISSDQTAKWCDQLYSTLPPLEYTPPTNRLKLLPKTIEAMRDGKKYRIVMLGDSIVNDIFNSNFQSLIMRNYPKSKLEFICSVRGSTGCWFYQDPVQFKKYVADLKPDLLIIGGISQKNNIPAITNVISQAKKLGCEIMLMTGPMNEDWREYDENNLDKPLNNQQWNTKMIEEKRIQPSALMAVANEFNVEFLDMKSPWHFYLGSSQKPWRWFHRDRVHANDRGKQINGRILERYFK